VNINDDDFRKTYGFYFRKTYVEWFLSVKILKINLMINSDDSERSQSEESDGSFKEFSDPKIHCQIQYKYIVR